MGSLRLFINKEAFEKSKAKYAIEFDKVSREEDKGKFYMVDVELASDPKTFSIGANSLLIDCLAMEGKQNNFYVKLAADITDAEKLKICAFMIDYFANLRNAMVTAVLESQS